MLPTNQACSSTGSMSNQLLKILGASKTRPVAKSTNSDDPHGEGDCVRQVNNGEVICSYAFSSRTVCRPQQPNRFRRPRGCLPNDPANHPSGNEGRASLQTRLSTKGWNCLIPAFADSASEDRFSRPAFLALSLPESEAFSDWKKRRVMGSKILSRSIDRNLPLYFIHKHAL